MKAEDQWQRLIADPATPDWVKAVLDRVIGVISRKGKNRTLSAKVSG